MNRTFTAYWRPSGYAHLALGDLVGYAGGNDFTKRGVSIGDRIYVMNVQQGKARLLGAFTVGKITDHAEAMRLRGAAFGDAEEHLFARAGTEATFSVRLLSETAVHQLRFKSKNSEVKFREDGSVDEQTLRGVRELEPNSAMLLENLLLADSDDQKVAAADGESCPIYADDGRLVKAKFLLRLVSSGAEVILESRSGKRGPGSERNPEYGEGLRILLSRLGQLAATLVTVLVESRDMLKAGLSEVDRRVGGPNYPIALTQSFDATELAASLQRNQTTVGSNATSGKGNATRRLLLRIVNTSLSSNELEEFLAVGPAAGKLPLALGPLSDREVAANLSPADFDSKGLVDARRWVERSLAQREGQPAFRRDLMAAYDEKCAITNCDVRDILEAAHIVPYWGPKTNHIQNGMLLRADLHTLFDRGLLGVDPRTWKVRIADKLRGTQYKFLDGTSFRIPKQLTDIPSAQALQAHLESLGLWF